MTSVENLYKYFGTLADAKEKAGSHEDCFLGIIGGVKGGGHEKRLASQFIARFFKFFPSLADRAIDGLFDLCEDDDVTIRKQAIKDLPSLCKEAPEHLAKVADVLVQLLQTDDNSELSMVQHALLNLFTIQAKGALGGLFSQILSGDDLIRERAIKFMCLKFKHLPESTWTSELEQYFLQEARKVLQDCTGEEFVSFMQLLAGLQHMKTMQGRQQLIELVADQSEMDKDFQASDPDAVDRLIQCYRQALPYFSKNVHSDRFVKYMCAEVLPAVNQLASEDVQLDLLKLFAELTGFCGELEKLDTHLQHIYTQLLEYMPLPSSDAETQEDQPDFKFSHVECLIYALHQLARKQPGFFTDPENEERNADFRKRLQYFARGVQVYIRQLRVALQGKTGDDLKTDENKIRVLALKTTNNIHTLVKDLFHKPPSYKSTVTLSWKPIATAKPAAADVAAPGQKRSGITPIEFESDDTSHKKHIKKDARSMYQPPTGKFSEKAGTYRDGGLRGGRGRGGRGRGRGRGFRQW